MKKVLSLSALFAMIVMGACSTAPGQEVVNSLIGTWTGTGNFKDSTLVFADKTVTQTVNDISTTLTLISDPETLTLGTKTYVVYKFEGTSQEFFYAFRADGNNLYAMAGQTLEEVKANYESSKEANPDGALVGTRQ